MSEHNLLENQAMLVKASKVQLPQIQTASRVDLNSVGQISRNGGNQSLDSLSDFYHSSAHHHQEVNLKASRLNCDYLNNDTSRHHTPRPCACSRAESCTDTTRNGRKKSIAVTATTISKSNECFKVQMLNLKYPRWPFYTLER